jgi:hypothetical protein
MEMAKVGLRSKVFLATRDRLVGQSRPVIFHRPLI